MNATQARSIRLFKTADGWMSTDSDPQVRELFGTDTLPTPFLASSPASAVYDTIRQLNPDAVIYVSGVRMEPAADDARKAVTL